MQSTIWFYLVMEGVCCCCCGGGRDFAAGGKWGLGASLKPLGTFPLICFTSCPVQLICVASCLARSLGEVAPGSAPRVSIRREEVWGEGQPAL